MRGRSGPVSSSKFQLKTLKVSPATIDEIRAPIIWNKPSPGLYDYHYDVAGLYYQPMINYCVGRESGEGRRSVDMPDRTLANLDKVAYARQSDDVCDYEGFLSKIYQRRAKDKHSKQIQCANALWSHSKKTTDLGMVRGAANTRDKYLCQIQLYHTGRIAKDRMLVQELSNEEVGGEGEVTVTRRSRRSTSDGAGEEVWEEERSSRSGEEGRVVMDNRETRRSMSAEPVREIYEEESSQERDPRYGPNFVKRERLDIRKLNQGRITGLDLVGVAEPRLRGVPDRAVERQVAAARAQYNRFREDKERSDKFLEAETQKEFLELGRQLRMERMEKPKVYKPLYNDTSYVKAYKDVDTRVREKGKSDHPVPFREDINVFYRRRRVEDIGKYEKAAIMSNMQRGAILPEFDIGYDTVERSMVCSK